MYEVRCILVSPDGEEKDGVVYLVKEKRNAWMLAQFFQEVADSDPDSKMIFYVRKIEEAR